MKERILGLLVLLLLASCEPKGQVVSQENEFGGKTVVEEGQGTDRMRLRKSYYDVNQVLRKEERYPRTDVALNLGFDHQVVTYDMEGNILSDLREAPEDLPNRHGYLSFLRTYGPGKKLLTGEIRYKELQAKELGYSYSTVIYNYKGRPAQVLYFDHARKQIFATPAKIK